MEKEKALYKLYLRLGDSCLIMGQRLAEWCSNAPTLEEDLALTNLSLDYFGLTEAYYTEALVLDPTHTSADHLAFRRNEQEYYNYLICEQPNGNFADTMVKVYLFSSFTLHLNNALKTASASEPVLNSLCDRGSKEMTYHQRHSADWLKRFSFGTTESREKLINAISYCWSFTDDLTARNEVDEAMERHYGVHLSKIGESWKKEVEDYFQLLEITLPEFTVQIKGGIQGKHTEHLGHLLCEMQFLQRAYPNATW